MKQKAILNEGSILNHLLHLAIPMAIGIFAVFSVNIVDTYFVGQLGTKELAAMSFTFPVTSFFMNIAFGIGLGATSIIARAIGKASTKVIETHSKYSEVQKLATDALSLGILLVTAFIIFGLLTMDILFELMGANPEITTLIKEYMIIWYFSMPLIVIPIIGNNIIRATGDTKNPAIIMLIAAFCNLVFDPLLIFGWGPIPSLRLEGAAYATAIARVFTLIASLSLLHFRENLLINPFYSFKSTLRSWKLILYIGIPASMNNVILPISIGVVTGLIASFGPEAVAGFGVATRIESFAMLVTMALASSLGPFIGQNWGAQLKARVRHGYSLSIRFCLAWGALCAIVLFFSGQFISSLFSSDIDVIQSSHLYLLIVPLTFGFEGMIMVSNSTFNAIGKPLPSTALTYLRMIGIFIPLAYLGKSHFGLHGIYFAAAISNLIVGILGWKLCTKSL